jgi:hypothetical protein
MRTYIVHVVENLARPGLVQRQYRPGCGLPEVLLSGHLARKTTRFLQVDCHGISCEEVKSASPP